MKNIDMYLTVMLLVIIANFSAGKLHQQIPWLNTLHTNQA